MAEQVMQIWRICRAVGEAVGEGLLMFFPSCCIFLPSATLNIFWVFRLSTWMRCWLQVGFAVCDILHVCVCVCVCPTASLTPVTNKISLNPPTNNNFFAIRWSKWLPNVRDNPPSLHCRYRGHHNCFHKGSLGMSCAYRASCLLHHPRGPLTPRRSEMERRRLSSAENTHLHTHDAVIGLNVCSPSGNEGNMLEYPSNQTSARLL